MALRYFFTSQSIIEMIKRTGNRTLFGSNGRGNQTLGEFLRIVWNRECDRKTRMKELQTRCRIILNIDIDEATSFLLLVELRKLGDQYPAGSTAYHDLFSYESY